MNPKEYLQRINYSGALQPTYDVLCQLQSKHLLAIPFENLDIHYGNSIALDIDQIFEKVIRQKRGGFCYELNSLFYELLCSIGFDAERISARVYKKDGSYGLEFDHLAILVTINKTQYLTDVGFGEFSFHPLKLALRTIQEDNRGPFVIDQYDNEYLRVNKVLNEKETPEYIFKIIPRAFDDFKNRCNFHQTSPQSHFTQKKLISRATENGRITISGSTLKIKEHEVTKEIDLTTEEAFDQQLWKWFGIKFTSKPT